MKRIFCAAALCATFGAAACAYYTPRNPHYHEGDGKKSAVAEKSAKNDAAQSPEKVSAESAKDVLGPGAWTPAARTAIDGLIAAEGFSSKGYDARKPPVAVLSWEGVFFVHDAAAEVFDQMVLSARFKITPEFWRIIPVAYGRQKIFAAYQQFSILPQSIWEDEPAYLQFRKYFVQSYQNQCEDESWSACRAFLAQLFAGFTPEEARHYAATVINAQLERPLGAGIFAAGPEDRSPARVEEGLRVVPEVSGLVAALLQAGFDVWVVDQDPQPVLEAATAPAGVPASRVVGIRVKAVKGVMTGDIDGDVPARGAKTAAVVAALGRAPDLVVGASSDDAALLGYGKGVRVLIDHGDKKLDAKARKKGWIVQPAFGR
ncbi:MAG TPA: hypothetical protein VNK24_10990 [Elusimicrobiota bacterium]|nr:hypothetical protein [Elusimicrobiota bacterium]